MKKFLLFTVSALLSLSFAQGQNVLLRKGNLEKTQLVIQKNSVTEVKIQPTTTITIEETAQSTTISRVATAMETILYQSTFEDEDELEGWGSYDLDKLNLANHNQTRGWYWAGETATNKVLASQSWIDDERDTHVDDWAVSPGILIPEEGLFSISWDARAINSLFRDGYEMRIADAEVLFGALDELSNDATLKDVLDVFLNNTEIAFSITEENANWTTRLIDINSKYKGKYVCAIWRNNTYDMERLYLDNVVFYQKPDYSASVVITETPTVAYTIVPEFLKRDLGGSVSAKISNTGSNDILGLAIETVQYENDLDVDSDYASFETIEAGSAVNYTSKGFLMDYGVGIGEVNEYIFAIDISDAEGNIGEYVESAPIYGPVLSDNIYARDNGIQMSGIGVDPNSNSVKQIGLVYGFPKNTYLEEVSFTLVQPSVGTTKVNIYNSTFQHVASSLPVTVTPGVKKEYVATFETPLHLMAGTYLVTLEEEPMKSLTVMYCSNNIGGQAYYFLNNWAGPINYSFNIRLKVVEGWATAIDNVNQDASSFNVVSFNKELTLKNAEIGAIAEVYNVAGQKVASVNVESANQALGKFDTGIYIVRIGDEKVKTSVK